VVTSTLGMGKTAKDWTLALPISMRPRSQRYPQTDQEPRHDDCADHVGAASAARTGRSGSWSGVLVSRRLAAPASWTIGRWSPATGGTVPTAAWGFGRFKANSPASVGNVLPGCLLAERVAGLGMARKHAAKPARKPAGEMPSASTRG
jgi:hypothetical protein